MKIHLVSDINFFGLTINEHLNWPSHIDKLANKISKIVGVLNKHKYYVPLNAMMIIFNSLILSHINYCILVWAYICEIITKLQKRLVRILSLSKYNSHPEPIFKIPKLLKVNHIIKLQELKFYYKYEMNLLPHYLESLPFQLNTNRYETRSLNNCFQWKPMHEYAKKCVQYNIPNTVNNITTNVIDTIYTHNMQGFTGYEKQSILQFYQQSCTIPNCYICSRS